MKTSRLEGQDYPMSEDSLHDLAWKAWRTLDKKLEKSGVSLMYPTSSAPEFLKLEYEGDEIDEPSLASYHGAIVARFYNNGEWLNCFVFDPAKRRFLYDEVITEELSIEDFYC